MLRKLLYTVFFLNALHFVSLASENNKIEDEDNEKKLEISKPDNSKTQKFGKTLDVDADVNVLGQHQKAKFGKKIDSENNSLCSIL